MVFDVLTRFVHSRGLTVDSFKDKSFIEYSKGHNMVHLYALIRDLYPSKERDWIEHWIRLCKLMLKFNTYKLFDKNPVTDCFNERYRINLIKEAVSMETKVKDINIPLEYVFLLMNVPDQNLTAMYILYELERKPSGVAKSTSYDVCKHLEEYLNNIDKPELRERIIDYYDRFNLN